MARDCGGSFFTSKEATVSATETNGIVNNKSFTGSEVVPSYIETLRGNRSVVIHGPRSAEPCRRILRPLCTCLVVTGTRCKSVGFTSYCGMNPSRYSYVAANRLISLFMGCTNGVGQVSGDRGGTIRRTGFLGLSYSGLGAIFN